MCRQAGLSNSTMYSWRGRRVRNSQYSAGRRDQLVRRCSHDARRLCRRCGGEAALRCDDASASTLAAHGPDRSGWLRRGGLPCSRMRSSGARCRRGFGRTLRNLDRGGFQATVRSAVGSCDDRSGCAARRLARAAALAGRANSGCRDLTGGGVFEPGSDATGRMRRPGAYSAYGPTLRPGGSVSTAALRAP